MVMDHGLIVVMETVSISQFKARCLAILAKVQKTGHPILVTRFGKPMAEVIPPPSPARPDRWLGSLEGSVQIVGDIVSPTTTEDDWESLRK
jgi:prevent-host-death family protein